MLNRRAFLAGLTATAAGLLVPERKLWALDRTMLGEPRVVMAWRMPTEIRVPPGTNRSFLRGKTLGVWGPNGPESFYAVVGHRGDDIVLVVTPDVRVEMHW